MPPAQIVESGTIEESNFKVNTPRSYDYRKLLGTKDVWPGALSRISVSQALEKAERMPDPFLEERSTQCRYVYKREPQYTGNTAVRNWTASTERLGFACTVLA
jgi:hypothetical protein